MGWCYGSLCLRFLSDIALQEPGLQAGLLLWQRCGDSLTRAGCAIRPSPQSGQGLHRLHRDTLPLVTSSLKFFIRNAHSFCSTMSYTFCGSNEAFMPEVVSLRFNCSLRATCKPLGTPTLRLCTREEQQSSLPYLSVRTVGEKEAKLFLTLT